MDKIITIYHGSEDIIQRPLYVKGKKNNDFGLGFYCTTNNEVVKEWAVNAFRDGYSNRYLLDTEYLRILNINSTEYTILNWIAVLLEYRLFSIANPIAGHAKKYIIENFSINVNAYDVIIGYRADDSYFDFANAFLNNTISIGKLAEAMKLGKLGEQIAIKSEFGFSKLKYDGYEKANINQYFPLKKIRMDEANKAFIDIAKEDSWEGLFVRDILKGAIKNDDPRIPRNVSF